VGQACYNVETNPSKGFVKRERECESIVFAKMTKVRGVWLP